MKKITLIIVSLFCFSGYAQKNKISPAKKVTVDYPTEENAFISRLQADIQANKLPVQNPEAYYAYGGKMHGITAEEFKNELLGNVEVISIDSSLIQNSAWYVSKQAYDICGTNKKTIQVLKNIDSDRLLIKVNCLNIITEKSSNTMDEFALENRLPRAEVVEGPPTTSFVASPIMTYKAQSEVAYQSAPAFQATGQTINYYSSPSTVVAINPVSQLPVFVSNNTYFSQRPIRNCGVYSSNQPTTWNNNGQFTANTTGTGTTETINWTGTGFSGNTNGYTYGETTPMYNGGNYSGSGSIPGVNQVLDRQGQTTTRRR